MAQVFGILRRCVYSQKNHDVFCSKCIVAHPNCAPLVVFIVAMGMFITLITQLVPMYTYLLHAIRGLGKAFVTFQSCHSSCFIYIHRKYISSRDRHPCGSPYKFLRLARLFHSRHQPIILYMIKLCLS